ncbi:MgtC/SapB family protein [Deinococcus geothermalis]|uniref:MgtC/SapB family protein n=1 Tax=Deinococcus geothermalis TaxID=68909 RepID=UPI0023554CBF|nr:MgtC/SapB family protein [Deinococcus geothermalis]
MQGLLAAFVLSGLIGWERQQRGHNAGLRTHILVGVSAALFVVLADTLILRFSDDSAQVRFDLVGVLSAVFTLKSSVPSPCTPEQRAGQLDKSCIQYPTWLPSSDRPWCATACMRTCAGRCWTANSPPASGWVRQNWANGWV